MLTSDVEKYFLSGVLGVWYQARMNPAPGDVYIFHL